MRRYSYSSRQRYHLISVACGRQGRLPGVSVRTKAESPKSACAAGRFVENDHGQESSYRQPKLSIGPSAERSGFCANSR